MKPNRGRLGQYKVLASEEKLQQHLIETHKYSFKALLSLLSQYKCISLKKAYGIEEVLVIENKGSYEMKVDGNIAQVSEATGLEALLQEILNDANYVMQPKLDYDSTKKVYRSMITMHRATQLNKWAIVSKYAINGKLLEPFAYYASFDKIKKLLQLVTEKFYIAYPGCQTIDIEITYTFNSEVFIYDTILHYSISKWSQYQALSSNKKLARYLPDTFLLTNTSFENMMNRYWEIIIKPCQGQFGNGIVKIEKKPWRHYEIHALNKIRKTQNMEDTFNDLKKQYFSDTHYIVQRRVPLATVESCPIDVRVMTSKVDGKWVVSGKLVKIAGDHFFITNAIQKVVTFDEAISKSSLWWKDGHTISEKIDAICLEAAIHLDQQVSALQHIGFDIAITNSGRIWLLEGNYKPDISMFYLLDNKTIHSNVMKHIRDAKLSI